MSFVLLPEVPLLLAGLEDALPVEPAGEKTPLLADVLLACLRAWTRLRRALNLTPLLRAPPPPPPLLKNNLPTRSPVPPVLRSDGDATAVIAAMVDL